MQEKVKSACILSYTEVYEALKLCFDVKSVETSLFHHFVAFSLLLSDLLCYLLTALDRVCQHVVYMKPYDSLSVLKLTTVEVLSGFEHRCSLCTCVYECDESV